MLRQAIVGEAGAREDSSSDSSDEIFLCPSVETGKNIFYQIGSLSLVEIHLDTVLWLVKMLLRQLSYAIKTQLKAPEAQGALFAFLCVFMA